MVTVQDVKAEPLIQDVAEDLEEDFEQPEWAKFARSGVGRERTPDQENWYHIRAAAILRRIYNDGPIGVSKLRTIYGGRKNNGHAPEHHAKASGKVIRSALQNLEEAGYLEIEEGEGRVITDEGKSFLDKKASKLA